MNKTEKLLHEIYLYCKENIPSFDMKEEIALERIDINRCPLWMADSVLYDEMTEAIEDYAFDNDIEDDIDPEDVFWSA